MKENHIGQKMEEGKLATSQVARIGIQSDPAKKNTLTPIFSTDKNCDSEGRESWPNGYWPDSCGNW